MKLDIVTMTPQWAEALLANNPKNRKPKQGHIAALARDMQRGDWQLNGDAIRVSQEGVLLDGQHRLLACVKSGVAFQTILIRGLSADVRATIDSGAVRTYADRLSMRGVPNASQVAAAGRLVVGLASGELIHAKLTASEGDRLLAAHPGLVDSASFCLKAFPKMQSRLAAIHYVGTYLGMHDRADTFVDVWRSGIPDYPGDPAHNLRERVLRQGTKIPADEIFRLLVTSWNRFVEHKPAQLLRAQKTVRIPGWGVAQTGLK